MSTKKPPITKRGKAKPVIMWMAQSRRGNPLSGHCSYLRKWLIDSLVDSYKKPWKDLRFDWGLRVIKVAIREVTPKAKGKK